MCLLYIDLWVITLVTNSEDHLVTFAMNNQNLVYWANSRKISVALAQVPSSMDECLPDCKPTQSSAWRTHPSAPRCWRCQRHCMTWCWRQIIYLEWTLCAQLPESRRGWNSKELFLLALLPRQTSNDSYSYWYLSMKVSTSSSHGCFSLTPLIYSCSNDTVWSVFLCPIVSPKSRSCLLSSLWPTISKA